ncbi:MAG: hypothetical protein JRI95_10045 [Deltaproteobacteria bacterium]|nr:hypothetical protein [Deltaproteobacteria bacterium]
MNMKRLVAFFVYVALVTSISACASFDRMVTKFEPLRTESGTQIFKFTAFADAVYPLESENAERTRIEWLEKWLTDNGYSTKKYEVISRVPVLRKKGLLGEVYDIFYEVRATK